MAGKNRSSGEGPSRAGCMLWLIALVVVLVLFLINLGRIRETLKKTNFKEVVQTQRSKEPEKPRPVPSAPKVEDELPPAPAAQGGSRPAEKPAAPAAKDGTAPKPGPAEDGRGAAKGEGGPEKTVPAGGPTAAEKPAAGKSAPERPPAPKPAAAPVKTRQANLYFVRIDDDGIIVRQEVKRAVPSSDSPLADAMTALLKGPTEDELRRKLLSLIPAGTRLLGAQVRGSTAFLNFSEAFMYNHYGIEGYAGQLKQVVYTATAFSTVQDVQILIEGERHDYLGGEGVYIGRPLSRNSF